MGDKFYNVELYNSGEEPVRFETSQTSFQPVIDEPNRYSVGVKRFKIPLSRVDSIRVYEGECYLGFNLDHTNFYFASISDPTTDPSKNPQNVRLVDVAFAKSWTAKRQLDTVTGEYYIAFPSQEAFVDALNATLNLAASVSFVNAYYVTATFQNGGIQIQPTQVPETTIAAVVHTFGFLQTPHVLQFAAAPNGAYSIGDFASFGIGRGVNADPSSTEVPSYLSRKLIHFELTFANYNLTSGFDMEFSGVEYFVAAELPGINTTTNALKTFCLCKGALPGIRMSEMATYFPHGFGFSLTSSLDPRFYDWRNEPIPITIVMFRPYDANRLRDEFLLSFGEYNKIAIAATTRVQIPPSQTATTMTYDIYWIQQSTNVPYLVRGEGVWGSGNSSIAPYGPANAIQGWPRFQWNKDTQKISLAVSNLMMSNGINFFMSPALNAMLGFDTGRMVPGISQIYTASTASQAIATGQLSTTQLVYELALLAETSTFQLPAILPGGVAQTMLVFSESQSSVWARDHLWGLRLMTNSLPIEGEYAGNGNERQKILSDFEVDPQAVAGARDYLLYQPSGDSVRFFDMKSDQPLSTIELRVLYVSRRGHSYPLMLAAGGLGTVKIQFRPK